MLKLPQNSQHTAIITGIDPGTESLGFSELEFDLVTFELVRWEPVTFTGSKLLKSSDWIGKTHGARYQRLDAYGKHLTKLFDQVEPYVIACESPFINMRRPQAYGALAEIVYEIRRAVMAHNRWKELYLIDPSTVKNSVGAKGNADKDAVKASVRQIPELIRVLTKPLDELDEHSIDSGAVAYAAFKNLRELASSRTVDNPLTESTVSL